MKTPEIPPEWRDAVEVGDFNTLVALADYFAEHNYDDASACLRWVVDKRRWPIRLAPWVLWCNWDEVEEDTNSWLAAVLPTLMIDILANMPGDRWSVVSAFERLLKMWTPAIECAVATWTPGDKS